MDFPLEMARSLSSLELDLRLSCQVCHEKFKENGDHVPRLLPCTHTMCSSCIRQKIQGAWVECSECEEKHEAKQEEESFPQNKYILSQIKTKSWKKQPIAHEFQKCEEHGNTLNIFCKEPGCNKPICRSCLTKQHQKHEVTLIEELEKEALARDVVKMKVNLETKVKIMCDARKNIGGKCKEVVDEIKKKRELINKYFEKMIKETEGQNQLADVYIDDELSAMYSNIELLSAIQKDIERGKNMNYEEIMRNRDTVIGITEHNARDLSGNRSFNYPDYVIADRALAAELSGESFAEELLGRVVRRNHTLPLPRPVKCSGTFYLLFCYLIKVRVSNEITHKRKIVYKMWYY